MKTILSEKPQRIIRHKKKLEKELEIKITNRGKEIYLEGNSEQEYIAEKVIDAINFGFKISEAISIKLEDAMFEILNIKDYSKHKNFERIKSRLIGKNGKCINTLRVLSGTFIELKENKVGIIADSEKIETITQAIIKIINGAKQSNAYAYLEKHRPTQIYDLGLKKTEENL